MMSLTESWFGSCFVGVSKHAEEKKNIIKYMTEEKKNIIIKYMTQNLHIKLLL